MVSTQLKLCGHMLLLRQLITSMHTCLTKCALVGKLCSKQSLSAALQKCVCMVLDHAMMLAGADNF